MGLNGFRDFYQSHSGHICDKWEQYIGVYDAELRAILARGQPVRMLEIGVQNGGSLELWARALPAGSEVIGIDIDPGCANLALPANAQVRIGDATDEAFLRSALGDQVFDLIIDDGSHRSADVIRSFQLLFPRLRRGGRYFIEDLHASYWGALGGGFRKPGSAIEFLKGLVDALHADHLEATEAIDATDLATLVALNREVARVSFVDSLAVIEKYAETKTAPLVRTLAGSDFNGTNAEWRHHLTDWSSPLIVFDPSVRVQVDADRRRVIADLAAQQASASAALQAQTEALAAARAEIAAAAAAHHALQATHDALGQSHAALSQSHAALGQSHAALVQAHDALRQSHGTLTEAHDALLQTHEALQRSHDELRQSRADLRRRLKAIKRTWTWRLSYPARWLERLIRRAIGH